MRNTLRMRKIWMKVMSHLLPKPWLCSGMTDSRSSAHRLLVMTNHSLLFWFLQWSYPFAACCEGFVLEYFWTYEICCCFCFQQVPTVVWNVQRLLCLGHWWVKPLAYWNHFTIRFAQWWMLYLSEKSSSPLMVLKPSSSLLCLEYNPNDPACLVGGCYNGRIGGFRDRLMRFVMKPFQLQVYLF